MLLDFDFNCAIIAYRLIKKRLIIFRITHSDILGSKENESYQIINVNMCIFSRILIFLS